MKVSKKFIVVTLILSLILSLMVGCSKAEEEGQGDVKTEEGQESGKTDEVKKEKNDGHEVTEETAITFPLPEQITLDVMINANSQMQNPEDLKIFKDLEASTNVNIEWEVISSGWAEKKVLMFGSNDIPDVIFGTRALNNNDIAKNLSFFEPLDEYIEKYCPNIQKMFDESPELKKSVTAADGHIYSLPQKMPLRPETRTITYINKKWLDALNLDVPQTTEEFYNALKAFKNDDPNGNGINDEIPLTFAGDNIAYGFPIFLGAFGITDNTTGDRMMVEDGKVSFAYADDRMIDAVNYLHKLYSEELIDQEVFTHDFGQLFAKMRNPDIAISGSAIAWTVNAAVNDAERAKEYVALPPLKGPKGDQLWRPSSIMSSDSVAFVMSKSNEHKAETMMWVDQFYNPELGVQLYFGPVGDCLELDADGNYTILPSKDPDKAPDAWMWANGLNDRSPIYISKEFEEKIIWNDWVAEKLETDKIYTPYIQEVEEFPPYLSYTESEIAELNTIKAEIIGFANQKMAEWIVNGNIADEWENYNKQLRAIGIERMIEIMQASYDRYTD